MTTTYPTSPQTGRRASRRRPASPCRNRAAPHASALPAPPQTAVDPAYLRQSSPLRSPDWRYQLAQELGRVRGGDPELLCIAGQLLVDGATDEGPWGATLIPSRQALAIRQGPDLPARAVLESHLLARRSPDETATAMRLPSAVVRSYAAVFYDVADRLKCCGFVAGHVFHARHRPEPTLGYALRVMACSGGPLALDDMLHAFDLGHLAGGPGYVSGDPELQDLSRRAAIATLLLDAAPHRGLAAHDLDLRYRRLQAIEHDPQRHHKAEIKVMRAVIRRVRRAFGVAARDDSFLATVLAV